MIHALIASTPLYLFIVEILNFFGGIGGPYTSAYA
jgi:hypothetical protein